MRNIRKLFVVVPLLLLTFFLQAQEVKNESFIGQTMRSNGRIYVVVAVMLTILAGLILYLVRLERKMSRLEKEN